LYRGNNFCFKFRIHRISARIHSEWGFPWFFSFLQNKTSWDNALKYISAASFHVFSNSFSPCHTMQFETRQQTEEDTAWKCNRHRPKRCVELYLHPLIRHHGAVLN